MSEMIERVAVAIGFQMTKLGRWPSSSEELNELGRAAIAAMREPTEKMVYVGEVACRMQVRKPWSAMIDEALK